MTLHRPISRASARSAMRALGVQTALEWAFRIEQAQLELPMPPDVTEEGFHLE